MNQRDELYQATIDYLEAYFLKRDLKKTLRFFDPMVNGCGTGMDEKAYGFDDFIRLFKRDIEQAPEKIDYELTDIDINASRDGLGIVFCGFNISTRILGQEIRFNNFRLSLIFTKGKNKWLIVHMHISLPTDAHEEDEAYPIKELEERNQTLSRLVAEKTESLHEALVEINKIAVTDRLTGLFNRNRIEESFNHELQLARRYKKKFAIILIDIDNFKLVNDCYGHMIGDNVLSEFSRVLSAGVRETDVLGRWGGEEFIIICPETDIDQAACLAKHLREQVETHHFAIVDHKTASFGVAAYQAGDNYDSLIKRVDQALYLSKTRGRNRVSVV